ncbi:hypothetical protein [Microbacterium sp. NPDC055683]
MGTNKRYPNLASLRAEERELREARSRGPLHTLTADQLRLRAHVVSIAPERPTMWALAWLRFGDADVRCTVRVKRWTSNAVGVEVDVEGETLRCWIWRGACQRLAEREDAWR